MHKMITLRYFGIIKELLNINEEKIEFPENSNTDDLLIFLRNRGSLWKDALSEERIFRLVVNHQMIDETTPLHAGDEVAILPPVTGG